jgi:hypothetical protein
VSTNGSDVELPCWKATLRSPAATAATSSTRSWRPAGVAAMIQASASSLPKPRAGSSKRRRLPGEGTPHDGGVAVAHTQVASRSSRRSFHSSAVMA